MDSIETLFYQLFHHSYVFLNSVPFDDVFKETIRRHTDLIVDFGKQEPDEWEFPQDITNSSIVNDVASKMSILNDTIKLQEGQGVFYGDIKTYHKNAQIFFRKKL